MNSRWKLVLKILGSTLFGILLLELALRLVGFAPESKSSPRVEVVDVDHMSMKQLIKHAHGNQWIHEPHAVTPIDTQGETQDFDLKRNWLGIREDNETPVEPEKGKYRIVVLGDSHTDGVVPNKDSYANVLEKKLGPNYDVLNCGQGVSSPYDQLWAYQKVFRRLKPKKLIIGFYAGNDFIDLLNQHNKRHLQWNGSTFVRSSATHRPDLSMDRQRPTTLETLADYTATFNAFRKAGWIGDRYQNIRATRDKEYFNRLVQARKINSAATWQGLNQSYFFKHCPDEWKMAKQKLQFVIDEFKKIEPEDGILFVIIPTYRQIDPAVVEDAAQVLELQQHDLEMDEIVCGNVMSILDSANIPYIDLRSTMKASTEKLFWDFDHHINDNGHRVVAEELEKMLKLD